MSRFKGVWDTYDAIIWPTIWLVTLIKVWHDFSGQETQILGDMFGWAWIFLRGVLCIWVFAWLVTRIKNL